MTCTEGVKIPHQVFQLGSLAEVISEMESSQDYLFLEDNCSENLYPVTNPWRSVYEDGWCPRKMWNKFSSKRILANMSVTSSIQCIPKGFDLGLFNTKGSL